MVFGVVMAVEDFGPYFDSIERRLKRIEGKLDANIEATEEALKESKRIERGSLSSNRAQMRRGRLPRFRPG